MLHPREREAFGCWRYREASEFTSWDSGVWFPPETMASPPTALILAAISM